MSAGNGFLSRASKLAFAMISALMIPMASFGQAPSGPPAGGPGAGGAQGGMAAAMAAMKKPFPPFHIIGNIYYVGSQGLACYIIRTKRGEILLDTGYPDMAGQIEANIQKLGFKLSDVKILINSHAHIDHGGGMAALKSATGAKLAAMAEDAPYFESGGHHDVLFGDRNLFPPVKVDRILQDGDTVKLGGVILTAHLTPGHTPGNTTWTMDTKDRGKTYHVVFFGIVTPFPNTNLRGNPNYPNMKADWDRTMRVLPTLKCDVFLASNGSFFDMEKKHDTLLKGASPNPFIDPAGCKAFVDRGESTYQKALGGSAQSGAPGTGSAR